MSSPPIIWQDPDMAHRRAEKTKFKLTDDVAAALMWQSGMAECHGVHDDDGEHAEAASGDDGTEPAGDDEDGGCA